MNLLQRKVNIKTFRQDFKMVIEQRWMFNKIQKQDSFNVDFLFNKFSTFGLFCFLIFLHTVGFFSVI